MKLNITIIFCFLLCINAKSQSLEKVMAKDAFEIVSKLDTANTILIDGRTNEMFSTEHIQGAININAFSESVKVDLKEYLEVDKIIVYCTKHTRADLIIEYLKELRYQGEIILILDGINGWISSGYNTISNNI